MTGILTAFGPARTALVAVYALMSAVTFAAYGLDKAAARGGGRRTPEATLHLLSLAGGWPGALAAQAAFRHKTIKQPFRGIFWMTVAANLVALTWLLVASPAWLG
jgi:uncharacterized membrane protein YsdA (DUF1294 family)